MSDAVWITLILAVTLLVMTGMICYTWRWIETRVPEQIDEVGLVPPPNEEEFVPEPVVLRDVSGRPAVRLSDEIQGATKEDIHEVLKNSPWPVDPDNLPKTRVYNPRPGSAHTPPNCECHKRPIRPGQTVMFWPLPHSSEVKVFCLKEDL